MRVNIYAEEMTDRIEIISKTIEGREFTGCRFYLELPVTRHIEGDPRFPDAPRSDPIQIRGPFMHGPDDDDSAAVTFWGKQDLRPALARALDLLDDHYDDAESHHITRVNLAFQMAGPETAGVVLEVARERNRQITDETNTTDHDDCHHAGVLAAAGACYAVSAEVELNPYGVFSDGEIPDDDEPLQGPSMDEILKAWPFHESWFKTTTPRRDLIKAAALIVAEIERIDRQDNSALDELEPGQIVKLDPTLPVPHRER